MNKQTAKNALCTKESKKDKYLIYLHKQCMPEGIVSFLQNDKAEKSTSIKNPVKICNSNMKVI